MTILPSTWKLSLAAPGILTGAQAQLVQVPDAQNTWPLLLSDRHGRCTEMATQKIERARYQSPAGAAARWATVIGATPDSRQSGLPLIQGNRGYP